ncbi:putative reverse transcriptase domain-containing protein [Tanacetum coccineum]
MGSGEKKPYGGSLPKCHFHHNGSCTQKCHKCNKVGHFAHDYRSSGNTNFANTRKGNGANPKRNGSFECGAPGHFKRDCPKLKNKYGEMGVHKPGCMQLGMQRRKGMHRGTRTPLSSQISAKKEEDKSEGKQLKDVPIVRDFPEVFPEDLPVKNRYPLRRIQYLFEDIFEIGLSPALDYESKIFQRRINKTRMKGDYEFHQVMPFGLTNAPANCLRRKVLIASFKNENFGFRRYNFSSTSSLIAEVLLVTIKGSLRISKIAKSMTKLTQKGIKFDWGEKEEKAFQLIKQKLCSALILDLPEGSEEFVVYCDASHKGLGAVLMQREKVIAYASPTL